MTTSLLHAGYPQSRLTLSAAPDNNPDTTQGVTDSALTDTARLFRTCRRCSALYPSGTYGVHRQAHPPKPSRTPALRAPSGRNAEIVAKLRGGAAHADLAREYGVTKQRIHQVWVRWGDGVSIKTFRELPPMHVRCACGAVRHRDGLTAHRQDPEHQNYERARFERLFWSMAAVREDGCWEWIGPAGNAGYGRVTINRGRPSPDGGVEYGGGQDYAHRTAYELARGPIPDGLEIDHLCRNRGCVNPNHLEAVTHRVNTLRSPIQVAAVNARKTHCKHGHEFTPENTRLSRNGRSRNCRACGRVKNTAAYRRRRARAA